MHKHKMPTISQPKHTTDITLNPQQKGVVMTVYVAGLLAALALLLHGCGNEQCVNMPRGNYMQHCMVNTCGTCEADKVVTFDPNTPPGADNVKVAGDLCSQSFTLGQSVGDGSCDATAHNCSMDITTNNCSTSYTLTFQGGK